MAGKQQPQLVIVEDDLELSRDAGRLFQGARLQGQHCGMGQERQLRFVRVRGAPI